jgi:hypothetical protein
MSLAEALADRIAEPDRRRTIRLIQPRAQLKLAAYVIIASIVFVALEVFNSWAAYARLAEHTLSFAPAGLAQEVLDQTQDYLQTSLVLLIGFGFCVLILSIGYLHRLLGPIVAFERCLRALRSGNYSARVAVRRDAHLYAELANELNHLAEELEESVRSSTH